ncbi:MAG: transcription termination/antitermination protein NusA [Chloroflexi bacterium]|nr:transcription termination/antitermination protein NusA [Chloroflexota bacterium]
MKSDFTLAFNEIVESRSLPREIVLEALSQALVSAYKRDANIGNNQRVEARIDMSGQAHIFLEKEVVDQVATDQTEVELSEARAHVPEAQLGDTVMVPVRTSSSFGRIAAQTAKQVILQRIREAERESLYDEFVEREGDLVTGTVQSVTQGSLTVSMGRAEAVMPRVQQIPGERYRAHDKIRVYVAEVKKNTRGPQIVVSRAHKNMLRRLLEYEVPEIYNGQVEIKNIAREAGYRSKVAVAALQEGVDPVGACVGMRGIRIQNIVKELNDEKIDVIEWNPDPAIFIGKALSPARVSDMLLEDDFVTGRTATVIVPDDQLSLAIGREGQNARLAAKLTGWRIDIKSVSEATLEAFAKSNESPLESLRAEMPDMLAEVNRIMEKKQANRPVQPEEYKTLTDFVKVAERRLLSQREAARAGRRVAMDGVRPLIPDHAYRMKIEELELDDDINQALSRVDNVGELMVRMLADETGLAQMLTQGGAGDDALEAIRYALDDLVILAPEKAQDTAPADAEVAVTEVAAPAEHQPEPLMPEMALPLADIDEDEEAPPAFIEPEPDIRQPAKKDEFKPRFKEEPAFEPAASAAPATEEIESDEALDRKRGKKSKRKQRELLFDEKRGEVVSRRPHKDDPRRWKGVRLDELDGLDEE